MSDPGLQHLANVQAQRAGIRAEKERIAKSRSYGDVSNLYGTANLSTHGSDELFNLSAPEGCRSVPLGRNQGQSFHGLTWNLDDLQGHAVAFGATRSGKGVSFIIPMLLSYGGSMVVIDPKGENAWATMERRKAMGQRVVVLDPWGEVQRRYGDKATPPIPIETARFNPLAAIDPASEDFADDVSAIADATVIPGLGEAHWTESARELIGGLTAMVCEIAPGQASLGDVRKLVAADPEDLVHAIKAHAEAHPDSLGAQKLSRFMTTTNEVSSVRSVAATQTAILDSRRLVDSMTSDEDPFDLAELGTGRVTLYLVLPLDRLETHGRWLRLIVTMAIRAIARLDQQPAAPVLFCLDEMGTIGPLRMVEQAFGLMAGVGIRIAAILQDLRQLQRDYPASWETFLSNASVILALKIADKTTSDYLSDLLGTTTQQQITGDTLQLRQQKPGWFKQADPSQATASTTGDRVHGRALLLPQEIRGIPSEKVLCILPGVGNYLVNRLPYFAPDSIWRGLYRSPPWFAAANANASAAREPQEETLPPSPPPASPVEAAKGWFLNLSTRAKAGVGVGAVVALYLVAHIL